MLDIPDHQSMGGARPGLQHVDHGVALAVQRLPSMICLLQLFYVFVCLFVCFINVLDLWLLFLPAVNDSVRKQSSTTCRVHSAHATQTALMCCARGVAHFGSTRGKELRLQHGESCMIWMTKEESLSGLCTDEIEE